MLVELSKSQDEQVGDGTTGVVILAGSLLERSLNLLEKKMHPLRVADGFEAACRLAQTAVEKMARNPEDMSTVLRRAAKTALCSKVVSSQADLLADICVRAVLSVAELERRDVNLDLI